MVVFVLKYIFSYNDLQSADLISGATYESGGGGFAKEPLHELFKINNFRGVGTQSGIRRSKVEVKGIDDEAYIVLVNTHSVVEWKNSYDVKTKILTYYGDNKTPGNDILNTKQRGNITFKKVFSRAYGSPNERKKLPPIFYFERTGTRSDMKFIGLALPYVEGKLKEEVLIEKEFDNNKGSFNNYLAKFTIIPSVSIKRDWLYDLKLNKKEYSPHAPIEWLDFIKKGYLTVRQENRDDSNDTFNLINPIYTQHTKEMVVSARLTQNKFKKALLESQKVCQICGIDVPELLIASHIKPWVLSEDNEKIDINNGLLLCANHDKLFDRHLISFDKDGSILISNALDKNLYDKLSLSSDFSLLVTEENEKYLSQHRDSLV